MTVLHQLRQEAEPISLSDLLNKLGKKYAERSVRRWLAELVKDRLVEKLGRKRATQYQASSSTNGKSRCFGQASSLIIEQVRRPIYERTSVTYNEEWFDAYRPNTTFYMPLKLRSQLFKAGKRSQNEEPAGTYARLIFNRLLIDLSYNSSRLEGNTYTLLDTERLVLKGKGAQGKLDEEKVMILNHKEAIRYLVDNAPRLKINKETICTLHFLLADGLLGEQPAGKIRDSGVQIGGSSYLPLENPRQLELHLNRIAQKAAQIKDPYEQSLFLLVHISYLQAFIDVNKRTARLSANIPLITHNLVPLSFNDIEREDYTSAMLAVYELQDVRPLVDVYAYSYLHTCSQYDSTVKALGFDEVRVRYRQERRALTGGVIRKHLVGPAMKKYVVSQSSKLVPQKDREAFIGDVLEDLKDIDISRIVGLGITPKQLKSWLEKSRAGQK